MASGKFLGQGGPWFEGSESEHRPAGRIGKRFVWTTAASLSIDEEAHDGATIMQNVATGTAFTLPKMPRIGFSCRIFVWTAISGGSLTVTTGDSDELLLGSIENVDTDSSNVTIRYAPDGSDDRILTFNGSTQGGLKASWASFEYLAPQSGGFGVWHVDGLARATGAVATPFS